MNTGPVTIVGAGLCGSLLAIMLARRGLGVSLLESRPDPRKEQEAAGRSINLALSARGIRALRYAGVFDAVEPLLMPMLGRLLHHENCSTEFQPYGQRADEMIFSVSRAALNHLLLDRAEQIRGISLRFHQQCRAMDADGSLQMRDLDAGRDYTLRQFPIIAADGAGSVVRRSLQASSSISVAESLLPHGYKELAIPPSGSGTFQLRQDVLHVWPRGGFMLIALPNPGADFTLTLFLSGEGADGFAGLTDEPAISSFFCRNFADVAPLIPDLSRTFKSNPTGILGTVRCRPWHEGGRVLLIGDAAHAIVPFHGQGMNLAFEDCLLLDGLISSNTADWDRIFSAFESQQRPNADAIADMALENYVEMRDTVRDPKFLLRKKLSFQLERRLPGRFIPRYSMVMFHDEIPYAVAQQRGAIQLALLEELTRDADALDQVDMEAAVTRVCEALPPFPK